MKGDERVSGGWGWGGSLVSREVDETETNGLKSLATCSQSLPFIRGSLSCSALKLISVCLCTVHKSQASLAQNHTHTLSLSLTLSPCLCLEAWSYKATCGKEPQLGSEEVELGLREPTHLHSRSEKPEKKPRWGSGGPHTLSTASKTGYAVPSIAGDSAPSTSTSSPPRPRLPPSSEAPV